ncbi:MAG TPA: hypothetical protein VGJ91_11170 [Polyangiaceae bacterium]|jgi:hypothetical protein
MADDEKPRRRLKLMNEVLPSPSAAPDATGPRARTLSHLQRLMSAAALLAACNKETAGPGPAGYGVVDPMPPPAQDHNKPDGSALPDAADATAPTASVTPAPSASSAGPVASASASATPNKVVPKPPPIGHGYGVVDPMPTPALRAPAKGDPHSGKR